MRPHLPAWPRIGAGDATDLLASAGPGQVVVAIAVCADVPRSNRYPLLELSAADRALRERGCVLRI
jgi:hypothetical protein